MDVNSFTTVPHGSKPVSSGKGNSHIYNYYASSYSMQLLCGKLAYFPSDQKTLAHDCIPNRTHISS